MDCIEQLSEVICGICGESHKYLECNFVEVKKHIYDKVIPSKARLTLPKSVDIIIMADGSSSVIANSFIPKGTQFGPLEAQKLLTLNPSIIFPLKLFSEDVEELTEYYLDTCDEQNSNWMIFVTPAQNLDEQNLICFQEQSNIYYVSINDIQEGEFLRVWYSPYYATKMKASVLTPQNSPIISNVVEEQIDLNAILNKQQKIMKRDNWTCKFCGKLEKNVTVFATHMLDHYNKRLRKKQCDICKQSFSSLRSLKTHIKKHNQAAKNLKQIKTDQVTVENIKTKDTILGGPLLNDLLLDSLDNSNLVLSSAELDATIANLVENSNFLEGDSLNVDNFLIEDVKELDHFNFEIGETQEQYVCDICLKTFSKLVYLTQHLKKHTGKYTCRYCLTIFCRGENLRSHKCSKGIKEPKFRCATCSRSFMLKKELIKHTKAVHEKKYTCENCNHRYYSDKDVKEHNCPASSDYIKPLYTCNTCNKTFHIEINLKKHLRLHSQRDIKHVPQKTYFCEICAHQLTTRKGYELHMRIHSEPTFMCNKCNKMFYREDMLKDHMLTHKEDSSQVACPVCNTKLKTKRTLASHMLQHSGDKPHKCNMCSEAYFQRVNLIRHYARHSKNCHMCKQKFNSHESLQSHMIEHSLNKVYVCPLCNKIVKLKSSIRRHIKQHHPSNFEELMSSIKPTEIDFDKNTQNSNVSSEASSESDNQENDVATNNTFQDDIDDFESIVNSFENIMNSYNSEETPNVLPTNYEPPETDKNEQRILDFNDLQMNMDSNFDIQPSITTNDREVCLSMPDLTEMDQDITLGENAYLLSNGTIVEQKDPGNVLVYVLDKKF